MKSEFCSVSRTGTLALSDATVSAWRKEAPQISLFDLQVIVWIVPGFLQQHV